MNVPRDPEIEVAADRVDPGGLIEVEDLGPDDADARVGLHELDELGEEAPLDPGVVVQQQEVVEALLEGQAHALVVADAESQGFLVAPDVDRIPELGRERNALVPGRAVVDHEHPVIGIVDREQGPQAVAGELKAVVVEQDDRDARGSRTVHGPGLAGTERAER